MEPLTVLTSVVAPLLRDDVDTDAIIPASYMRSLSTDPATGLFARWRYRGDGSDDPAFVLNQPAFRNARILLAGRNFGCGSSRENAVWSLQRYGIRSVVALGFSDIFRENAFKNGVLPLELTQGAHIRMTEAATAARPLTVTIDVRARQIVMPDGDTLAFALDERHRTRLLTGMDDIEETLSYAAHIEAFREQHGRRAPWLYAPQRRSRTGTTR